MTTLITIVLCISLYVISHFIHLKSLIEFVNLLLTVSVTRQLGNGALQRVTLVLFNFL